MLRPPEGLRSQWSFAVVCLGIAPDDFWDLTPADFDALERQYRRRQDWWDAQFGYLRQTMVGLQTGRAGPLSRYLLMRPEREKAPSPEALVTQIEQVMAGLGAM